MSPSRRAQAWFPRKLFKIVLEASDRVAGSVANNERLKSAIKTQVRRGGVLASRMGGAEDGPLADLHEAGTIIGTPPQIGGGYSGYLRSLWH